MELGGIKDKIEKAIIAVATANRNNKPHVITIMFAKVKENKLIITDNFMRNTVDKIFERK